MGARGLATARPATCATPSSTMPMPPCPRRRPSGHYEAGQPTSVKTQWDLAGHQVWQRSEWRDSASTLNRATLEEWDHSGQDWDHALTRMRGPSDAVEQEERWYDDNRYRLTLQRHRRPDQRIRHVGAHLAQGRHGPAALCRPHP